MSRYQLLPPLSQSEYDALRDDIAAAGVRQPIDVDENGDILDGHHRKQIADELGIDCPERIVRGLADFEKADYALTVNLARRHLDRDAKRELVKRSLKLHPRLSDREHARRCGVSHPMVAGVRDAMAAAGQLESFTSRLGGDGRERPSSNPHSAARTAAQPEAYGRLPQPSAGSNHPETGEAHAGLNHDAGWARRSVEADGVAAKSAGDGEAGSPPASPQTAVETEGFSTDGPARGDHSTAGPAAGPDFPTGPAVTPDPELQAADYMARFSSALAKAGSWMQFDAERVAELASPETWDAIEAHAEVVAHTYDRMRKARRTLRVLPGGAA